MRLRLWARSLLSAVTTGLFVFVSVATSYETLPPPVRVVAVPSPDDDGVLRLPANGRLFFENAFGGQPRVFAISGGDGDGDELVFAAEPIPVGERDESTQPQLFSVDLGGIPSETPFELEIRWEQNSGRLTVERGVAVDDQPPRMLGSASASWEIVQEAVEAEEVHCEALLTLSTPMATDDTAVAYLEVVSEDPSEGLISVVRPGTVQRVISYSWPTGLDPGERCYRVQASDVAGNSFELSGICAVLPPAPEACP